MSVTLAMTASAVAISLGALLPLARRDPKRLRNTRGRRGETRHTALGTRARRLLGFAAVAPGLLLIGAGQWPALLIWLAAFSAAGWTLALLLAPDRPRSS